MSGAVAFDESKHPRGEHGRFAAGSGSEPEENASPISSAMPISMPQRRTLERMPSWHRLGAKIHELPTSYTGSRDREPQVGSFKQADFNEQIPRSMTIPEHQETFRKLKNTIQILREPIVAAGQEPKKRGKLRGTVLIPPGTEKRTIHRAYNHAAMLALHGFGAGTYNFAMDDATKTELTPMTDFMRFARRRMLNTMLATQKGAWKPYRQEFGQPFADQRRDKVTGAVRLRVPPNDQLIKAVLLDGYTGLEKAFGLPAVGMPKNPNIVPVAQAQGVSRFDRYRKAIAMAEGQGHHSLTPLTPGQLQERRKAGVDFRKKLLSGAPRVHAGQAGSIAGLHIPAPTSSVDPHDPGITGANPADAHLGGGMRRDGMRIGSGVTLAAPRPVLPVA